MKAFVDWVLARRYRLIAVASVTAIVPLLQLVSTALIALEAVRRGVVQAVVAAAIGLAALVAISVVAASDATMLAALVGISFVGGLALGALLRWAGGLSLAFQGIVLLCVGIVLAISLIGPGPEVIFAPLLDALVELLRERDATDAQIAVFRETQPVMFGVFAAGLLVHLVAALCLTYWWRGLAAGDTSFGSEFRDLRLSRVLGFPASALVAAGLVLDAPLVQNLTPLALFGFLFQGLGVMHAWAHAKRVHGVLLVPVYVLLVTPLLGLVVILGLSAVGLLDNWFDLRAPLRSRT